MNQEDKELELAAKQLALAIDIAKKAHKDQFRRDGKTPYMQHVRLVVKKTTSLAMNLKVSKLEIVHLMAVAYLHDVIEDHGDIYHPVKLKELGVDPDIIAGVQALTREPDDEYDVFIANIAYTGRRWIVVKIADMLANLSDDPSLKQINRYSGAIKFLMNYLPFDR